MKTLIIFLISPFLLLSQDILISEYYNSEDTESEWAEFIVAEENLDLSLYRIRDNSNSNNSPAQWQGGIIFKDIEFWKNMPRGLVIVIYFRENSSIQYDADITNGQIILNSEDENYFEKFCDDCQVDPDSWEDTSLLIERSADILQILDPSGISVHAIGHTLQDLGDFDGLNGLMTDLNLPRGNSLVVFPGNVKPDYNQGFDNSQDYLKSSSVQTIGEANNLGSFEEENAQFWYDLRSSYWQDPELEISKQEVGFLLDWNDADISNKSEIYGYMVVRYEDDNVTEPINGNIYQVGDLIGSGRVIRVSSAAEPTIFNDQSANKCGITYYYYVYSYKFNNGATDDKISYFRGLGRTYNTIEVASSSIDRNDIQNFNVLSLSGEETICYPEGENPEDYALTLATTLQETDNLRFTWTLDNNVVFQSSTPGEFSQIEVFESGLYLLQIINEEDCLKLSNNFLNISIQEKRDFYMSLNGVFTFSDTLINACDNGGGVLLSTDNDNQNARVDWYLSNGGGDGDLLQSNSPNYQATFEAEYFAVISDGACVDTTNLIEFEYEDQSLSIDKQNLELITNINDPIQETITLKNDGNINQEFAFDDFLLPNNISIISPNLPFVLAPGESKVIEIEYNSNSEESYIEDLVILSDCNEEYKVEIKASSNNGDIAVIPSSIIFPTLVACGQNGSDTTVTIVNNSPEEISLQAAAFSEQFKVQGLPLTINGNSSTELVVTFNTQAIGNYNTILVIPYLRNGIESNIEINLTGRVALPEITIANEIIDFGIVAQCESQKDTSIAITNNSGIDFTIPDINVSDFRTVNTPLQIPDGETANLVIRFERLGVGFSDAIAGFDLQPCNAAQSLRFIGEKKDLVIAPENEIMNFGNNLICDLPYIDTLRNRFVITDEFNQLIEIDSILVPEDLNISLQKGDEIISGTPFEVFVNLNEEVDISDIISIRVSPCNNWYNVPVIISTQKPELTFIDTLFFKDVAVGTPQSEQNLFQNPSTIDVEFSLKPLSNTDVFTFDLDDKFLPFGINGIPLGFTYSPNTNSNFDTLLVEVSISEPCNLIDTLVLVGNVFNAAPETAKLIYSIDGGSNLELNQTGVYTISLEIISDDIDNLEINNSNFSLAYNPFALDIKSVSDNSNSDLNLDFSNDVENGMLDFSIEFDVLEEFIIKDFATIEVNPLLGNELITNLELTNPIASGNTNFTIESDSLQIEISGNCQLEERLLKVSNSVNLNVIGGELSTGNLEIDFSIVTSDITNISLINLESGSEISLVSGSLNPGSYTLTLDGNELTSGLYFVKMQSGIALRETKFLHIN